MIEKKTKGIVTNLFECPKCQMPMSADTKPDRCPSCKFVFSNEKDGLAQEFKWEKTPSRQFFELVQQDMEKYLDMPLVDIARAMKMPLTLEQEKAFEDAVLSNAKRKEIIENVRGKERDLFFMNSSPDDVEEWVKTIHYLMTMAIPSGNKELISKLSAWGMEIGKMAKVLTDYLNSAGKVTELGKMKTIKELKEAKEDILKGENHEHKTTDQGDDE
jgi:hypothetical protein